MDEFGVLTERFGLKPKENRLQCPHPNAPQPPTTPKAGTLGGDSGLNSKTSPYSSRSPPANSNSNSDYGSFLDDLQSSSNNKTRCFPDYDDIFGGGSVNPTKQSEGFDFTFDSIFSDSNLKSSSFSSYNDDYDVFGEMTSLKSTGSLKNNAKDDDIFGSFASDPKQSVPVDDLLGNLSGVRTRLQTLNVKNDKKPKIIN